MGNDSNASPTPTRYTWLPIVLAVPQAIAAIILIVDRLRPTAVYAVFLSLLATLLLFACMSLLGRVLRRLDWRVSALVLLAFSAGIVAGIVLAGWTPSPIAITHPRNTDRVGSEITARGTVDGVANAKVWVIVHPIRTDGYWVQQMTTPSQDGTWAETVCFGSSDTFQMMAVVNPRGVLKRGQVLDNWPEAEAKSQIVEVIR